MSTASKHLGRSVRALRTLRGLTQAELADVAGVARKTLSRVEGGTCAARPATFEALARALRVRREDLSLARAELLALGGSASGKGA